MAINKLKGVELTLALIKPSTACMPYCMSWIEKEILSNQFYILEREETYWSKQTARKFYEQHKEKFFFNRLVDFMSSGPLVAFVLGKSNAISDWRELIGPTKVYQTKFTNPSTFRGRFGLSDTRNSAHGSDSSTSAEEEINFVFPNFNYQFWTKQSSQYIDEKFEYDTDCKVHRLVDNKKELPLTETLGKHLGDSNAWSKYYKHKQTNNKKFDLEWFTTYENIIQQIGHNLQSSSENNLVLDLGSGVSLLAPSIKKDFSQFEVHCLDVSLESLRLLSAKTDCDCTFVNCDITQSLPYNDNSAMLILDKGTSDAVIRHNEDGTRRVQMMLFEVVRVLKVGGKLLQVTTDCPESRLPMLNCIQNRIKVSYSDLDVSGNTLPIYLYTITKVC